MIATGVTDNVCDTFEPDGVVLPEQYLDDARLAFLCEAVDMTMTDPDPQAKQLVS